MAKRKHKATQAPKSFDQKQSSLDIVYICVICQTAMPEPIKAYVKGYITYFVCSDICYRGCKDLS